MPIVLSPDGYTEYRLNIVPYSDDLYHVDIYSLVNRTRYATYFFETLAEAQNYVYSQIQEPQEIDNG